MAYIAIEYQADTGAKQDSGITSLHPNL